MPKEEYYYKLDENKPKNLILLNLLKKHDLSVSELARRVGLSKSSVSIALNKQVISGEGIKKIADYFGLKVEDIFNEELEQETYRNRIKECLREMIKAHDEYSKEMGKIYDKIRLILKA